MREFIECLFLQGVSLPPAGERSIDRGRMRLGCRRGRASSFASRRDLAAGTGVHHHEPVIIRNLQEANNLNVPDFYRQHGIVSTIDVVIKSIEGPAYGVLEVDSPVKHIYDTHDINFLTGFANVLAEAVATQTLLAENRLLARELHHRVRNNLQLIQGLLDRCAARVSDDQARQEIESIALRVMTLAQVQDQLLGTGMSRTIDFGDYLKSLCAILPDLQTVQTGNVHLTCDAELVVLDLDTVTSLGMAVAELATNSYSHAFPDGREGSISVSLSRSRPHKTATLKIKDNGIGFDGAPESKRYGLGLVRQLVEKVHGTVDVRSGDGATWTLTVPALSF